MRLVQYICVAGLFVAALAVGGCGGGGAQVRSELYSTTVGQELIDLQKARDRGAISQEEYEKQRKKILERQ